MKDNKWIHIIIKHCKSLKNNPKDKIYKNIDKSLPHQIHSFSSILTINFIKYLMKSILIFANNHFIILNSISNRLGIIFSKHIINIDYKFQCNKTFQDISYLIFFCYSQNENNFTIISSTNLHQAQKWAYKSFPLRYFTGIYPFQEQQNIHSLFDFWIDTNMQNNWACHSY